MKKYIRHILLFGLLITISSCEIFSTQKQDAKKLALQVDVFKEHNNTKIEFLTYIDLNKNYSYIVDSPVVVNKVVSPDIAIVAYNNIIFAIEFNDQEMYQSFTYLKVGIKALFQEGILLSNGSYYDKDTKQSYKKFKICRSNDCREVARDSLAYIYKYNGVDPTIPGGYKTGDLHKYLVDVGILGKKKPTTEEN